MAEGLARVVRDGAQDGEQAPCILVHVSLDTAAAIPFYHHVIQSLHVNISSGRAQAGGMVALAVTSPPNSYHQYEAAGGPTSWFQVVDCFSDPLGWEQELDPGGSGHLGCFKYREMAAPLDRLLALVVAAGRAAVKGQPRNRFAVLLDSVSDLLRYHQENLPAVAGFVSSLRSHAEVSAMVMVVRAGSHEARTVSGLAYLSSVNVYLEPHPSMAEQAFLASKVLERNMSGGRVRVRQRRRNGRYREEVEEFEGDDAGIKFSGVADRKSASVGGVSGFAQVKFNLQLTAKELEDRARVVLPFEHQGQGKELHIYDGRAETSALRFDNLSMSGEAISSSGEIHYLRDSDGEAPDSDEDPDDDLDI